MERQQYLNIMILHHLPKVVNMMQMFNMMMLGLVVSQPVFFLMAVSGLQKSLRISPKKLITKIGGKLIFLRKFLDYIALTAVVCLFLLLNSSTESILLITTLLVLLVLINRLITIKKVDLPANQMMIHHWK